MGSAFTLAVTGEIEKEVEAGSTFYMEAEEPLRDSFYSLSSDITFENAEVTEAKLTITASIRVDNVEVEVGDFADFDAESAIDEALGYDAGRVRNAEFEVEDGPTGWDTLEPILGQEQAIEVLVALKRDGLEIS